MDDNKTLDQNKDLSFNTQLDNNITLNNLKDIINKIKIIKPPEHLNKYQNIDNFIPSIKNDNKMNSLLIRTYYLKEIDEIEQYINCKELIYKKYKLSNEEYSELISIFNKILNIQNLCLNKEEYLKCLKILNKIVNILKGFIIDKIGDVKSNI